MEIGCDNYVAAYHQAFGIPPHLLRAMAEEHGRRYSSARLPDGRRRPSVLSPRQCQVLELVSWGLFSEDVAKILGIGIETVKTHLKVIKMRLNANNRTHAVAIAIRKGYILPPPRRSEVNRWDQG